MKVQPYVFFPMDFMFEMQGIDATLETLKMLQQEAFTGEFTLFDLKVSTRVFNHWLNFGLLPDNKVWKSGKAHQLNFSEYIWVKFIKELREFGVSLEMIKTVKQQLYAPIDNKIVSEMLSVYDKKELTEQMRKRYSQEQAVKMQSFIDGLSNTENNKTEPISYLHYLIMVCILQRKEVRILVDINGKVVPRIGDDENAMLEAFKREIEFDSDSYLSISLFKFFKNFLLNKKYLEFASKNMILNDNEVFIMSLIREGKAKAINIKFENEKPSLIEMDNERKLQIQSKLSEILLKKQYQELIVKTQDGDIAL